MKNENDLLNVFRLFLNNSDSYVEQPSVQSTTLSIILEYKK